MDNKNIKEMFYRLAKEELAAKGINDSKAIEELVKKYYDDLKNVNDNNIKDDRAKQVEKNIDFK
ncbi:hypothetical protein [Mesomycoplasma molare]|uniref:Uncharacterized protein n=1 Tax=Mesomycoplasma molare TaxID=171288 RepID=A0ABY5TWB3_9BACT|nr:hypothetical protein [Mesomycoplasma molare]UWD33881.1 hypothetical protein NX772_02100 [Mesomycoplasma molare]